MSIYLSRSFPGSNSSCLCSGNSLQSEVLRLEEELVDAAGPGTPIICMKDELKGVPIYRATRKVVGSKDVVAGERILLLLPRIFRRNRALIELNKILRTNKNVKGFILEKVKGGYSVAIAGFITFIPFLSHRISNDKFTIESIKKKIKRRQQITHDMTREQTRFTLSIELRVKSCEL